MAEHSTPEHWGIRPVLFHVGGFGVPAYSFFVLLGLAVGVAVYFYEAKKGKKLTEQGFFIFIGSLAGGALGAKLMELAINYKLVLAAAAPDLLLSGRTIVGGLIGGAAGAALTKRALGLTERRGNFFAPAIAAGLAIGRLGCFFQGCCYGAPTTLPSGVNFGDNIPRHPAQLYESAFMLLMFVYLEKVKNRPNLAPGRLFDELMLSYFTFRFFIEFIRVEKAAFWGLTVFQLSSLAVIIYLNRGLILNRARKQKAYA